MATSHCRTIGSSRSAIIRLAPSGDKASAVANLSGLVLMPGLASAVCFPDADISACVSRQCLPILRDDQGTGTFGGLFTAPAKLSPRAHVPCAESAAADACQDRAIAVQGKAIEVREAKRLTLLSGRNVRDLHKGLIVDVGVDRHGPAVGRYGGMPPSLGGFEVDPVQSLTRDDVPKGNVGTVFLPGNRQQGAAIWSRAASEPCRRVGSGTVPSRARASGGSGSP